jgi:uncharacterized protein with ParB-like and HNH nuclease domain
MGEEKLRNRLERLLRNRLRDYKKSDATLYNLIQDLLVWTFEEYMSGRVVTKVPDQLEERIGFFVSSGQGGDNEA